MIVLGRDRGIFPLSSVRTPRQRPVSAATEIVGRLALAMPGAAPGTASGALQCAQIGVKEIVR